MARHLLQDGKAIFIVLILAVAIILCVYIMAILTDEPLGFLTEDPLQTAKMPFYTGLLSNLCAMLWIGAATINFMATNLFWENHRMRWFFLTSMAVTLWLGLDDLFLFHDQVFRSYIPVPEKVIFLTYGLLIGAYLIYFFKVILSTTNYFVFFIAMVLLGTSMAMDIGLSYSQSETFIEDSIKFIGIAFLFYYYFQAIVNFSRRQMQIA